MHELTLCRNIVDIVESEMTEKHYQRVKTVYLEVGLLAGVEKGALLFCFDVVAQDSLLAGARLKIIDIHGKATCKKCGRLCVVQKLYDACPFCGAYGLQLIRGNELRIKTLEVE